MTDRIRYDYNTGKFFIVGDTHQSRTFDSNLEAKDALREIEVLEAVNAEVDRIVAWLRAAGYNQIAAAIEAREYKETNNA